MNHHRCKPGPSMGAFLLVVFLVMFPGPGALRAENSSLDLEQFMEQSLEGLRVQTEAHAATWSLGREESWNVDQERGEIRFNFDDGTLAVAPVHIIGTYSPIDSTFLWGWDHPSVREPLRAHAALVKAYGEEHGHERLTTRMVICTEEEAWAFTALATRLAEANGAYRGDTGGVAVFMTFGEVTLSNRQK